MDVRLTREQKALRDSASAVVEALAPRTVADLQDAERAAKLDAAVAATGWRELRSADDDDQPLASGVEAAIVAEELGRGVADVSFIGPLLAEDLRRRAGAPSSSSGAETVALTPTLDTVADAAEPSATAIDAAQATAALLARTRGDDIDLVSAPLPGTQTRNDLTRPVARPDLGAVTAVSDAGPLSADDFTAWSALAVTLTCADLVGVMRGAVTLATEYAKVREQYGHQIGSYQAVQHLLADAHVAIEGSASVMLHAAWAVDALPAEEALASARLAKAYCSRAARMACETVIQVHGGIGNTWEAMPHVFLRRALHSTDLFGGTGASLEAVLAHRIGDGHGLR